MTEYSNVTDKKSKLSAAKQALLEKRLRGQGGVTSSAIPRRQQQNFIPLSFAQQRLWFLDQLQPGNPSYNVTRYVNISGSLDHGALKRSLGEILKRHESLRTTFSVVNGEPVQVIHPARELPLPFVNLSDLTSESQQHEISRLSLEYADTAFNLTAGPLFTACLVSLNALEHRLYLSLHHIITDAWSTNLLLRQLVILYEAFAQNKPSPLPELPIQYADFAIWQREFLSGDKLNKQLSYWKQQLAGAPAVLELPLDRPRPAMQTFRGAYQSIAFPESLTLKLKDIGRSESATLFMTLLAAFQILLWRHTRQDDILVGAPIANRTRQETESVIGFFVNTLVMRSSIRSDMTFRELLHNVKDMTLAAYNHQDLPFEKLVEELQPERSLSHNPLFQVTLALQNVPPALSLGNFAVNALGVDGGSTRLDLECYFWDQPDGLICSFVYSTDLFDQSTIERLLQRFRILLDGITTDPNACVSDLPLLTATERKQLLARAGETEDDASPGSCIHELFEEQVSRRPHEIAVSFQGDVLSYDELNRQANRLAHYLIRRGVGNESLVGVCLDRSLDLVVALMGILKSGGAYVPLDPAYPAERLAFITKDAGIHLVLTQDSLKNLLSGKDVEAVCLDSNSAQIARESDLNPLVAIDWKNLVYVIYTSGSTGKPKGVEITHENVMRLLETTDSDFHFGPSDVWTLFHSYAFDFSVWEIWGALLYGARLVVVPYLVSRSPADFYQLLCREKVTVLNQTPSAFRQLMDVQNEPTDKLSLREVIFGGEALELQTLKPWFSRHGDTCPRLVNMYGITETTVHVTYRPLSAADAEQGSSSIIGRPLNDLQLYILDRQQQLAPIGVPGEIYVGGRGLARGYLKRPQLSAERFVPDPFSAKPGTRLYRTGDLARYQSTGELEYLGRIDRQVKIRGFRIELGEIEATLTRHDSVRDCLVLSREHSGDRQLLAYVIFEPGQKCANEALRSFLKDRLPAYMVPAFFLSLDQFPLTPNGKIDERALPLPEESRSDSLAKVVAPRTETEARLVGLWKDVLGPHEIGIYDNFFDLGGHSLLATQIMARIRETFSVTIPLRYFFTEPTVAKIAEFLQDARKDSQDTLPEIKRLPRS